MLRDAALLTLDALDACLAKGFVLKDATAFNVLFEEPRVRDWSTSTRSRPASRARCGRATRSFCRAFLFPLLLLSHKGLDPRPLLLAGLGEIPVTEARARLAGAIGSSQASWSMSWCSSNSSADLPDGPKDVSAAGRGVKYPLAALQRQVAKLRAVVSGLKPPVGDAWGTYTDTHTYDEAGVREKEDLVTRADRGSAPAARSGSRHEHGPIRAPGAGGRLRGSSPWTSVPGCIDALYLKAAGDSALSPIVGRPDQADACHRVAPHRTPQPAGPNARRFPARAGADSITCGSLAAFRCRRSWTC